jgi:uncharacterized protein YkwD
MRWRILLLAVALLAATTTQASATNSVASDEAHSLMTSINQARTARGLVPLRLDPRLWAIAGGRAGRLAASGTLSHAVAGSLQEDVAARGVRWYGYGEVIGFASGLPGAATSVVLRMWASSSEHWPLLMGANYNYLGVGVAYRPGSGESFASVVLTESPDRTGARAAVSGAVAADTDILWSWRGWDPSLQSHTAGLGDFTVQLRTDRGVWVTIARDVTVTARSTPNRDGGHWYGLRVRARDGAGNVGPWSRERRVWLP